MRILPSTLSGTQTLPPLDTARESMYIARLLTSRLHMPAQMMTSLTPSLSVQREPEGSALHVMPRRLASSWAVM